METEYPREEREVMIPQVPAFIIAAVAFLVPFFFVPLESAQLGLSKTIMVLAAVAVLAITYAASVIKNRSALFSLSIPLFSVLALPVAYLISSVFSSYPAFSLWGYQLDFDTFGFIALGAALSLMTALSVHSVRQLFRVIVGVFLGGVVVVLFQLFQLFFGHSINYFLFASPLINLVGSWYSLGVFMGLIATLALVVLESMPLSLIHRVALSVLLVVSVLILAAVNFLDVWVILATVAFAVFLHRLTSLFVKNPNAGGAGIASLILLIACLFFIFAGSSISTWLQNSLHLQSFDVRPSAQGTLAVAEGVYAKTPIFGTGPNTFGNDWLLYRPASSVATAFWNSGFSSGFASIPSAATVGGILVSVAWSFLLGIFLITMIRALVEPRGAAEAFGTTITAAGLMYLFAAHLFFAPDVSLSLLLFLFIGLFLASLKGSRFSHDFLVSFTENPRLGFASLLFILLLAIASVFAVYGGATIYASTLRSQEGVTRASNGDYEGGERATQSAITLFEMDQYDRSLATIELARLNAIANDTKTPVQQSQAQFKNVLNAAISAANRATTLGPDNYYNWLARATVYAAIVPLKVPGALENAVAAFDAARKLNPATPEIDYRVAQMYAALSQNAKARSFAQSALAKKADYTPAILLLAQLSLSEGNLTDAIAQVSSASALDPQNSQLLYELGLLQFQSKDYSAARDSFLAALQVTPDYANASFFLGRSYYELGQKDLALQTFLALKEKNQDNQVLNDVLTALQKGENPFQVEQQPSKVKTPTQ